MVSDEIEEGTPCSVELRVAVVDRAQGSEDVRPPYGPKPARVSLHIRLTHLRRAGSHGEEGRPLSGYRVQCIAVADELVDPILAAKLELDEEADRLIGVVELEVDVALIGPEGVPETLLGSAQELLR